MSIINKLMEHLSHFESYNYVDSILCDENIERQHLEYVDYGNEYILSKMEYTMFKLYKMLEQYEYKNYDIKSTKKYNKRKNNDLKHIKLIGKLNKLEYVTCDSDYYDNSIKIVYYNSYTNKEFRYHYDYDEETKLYTCTECTVGFYGKPEEIDNEPLSASQVYNHIYYQTEYKSMLDDEEYEKKMNIYN